MPMLLIKSRLQKKLEQEMSTADTYDEWFALARRHDRESGAEIWRQDERSPLYDYYNINNRLQNLRRLAEERDDEGLLFTLHEGIHGNMAGIGRSALYREAKCGTKHLIEDYVAEVCTALDHLARTRSKGTRWTERLEFFKRASHCYGRSALMLSGGGALGNFHFGVLKALVERQLCPVVISGASAGACVAAIVGTHSDQEFLDMFKRGRLARQIARDHNRVMRAKAGEGRMNLRALKKNLSRIIPDMTFLEAYEKTGRSINISISPAEPRQNSRLLNHIASPNVTIQSAVLASTALPGFLPSVQLEARDVKGSIKPYLPSRRWIDGSFSHDLPAQRLARMYGVNHFMVSQVLPGLGGEPDSNAGVRQILQDAYVAGAKQVFRGSVNALQRRFDVGPRIGTVLNTANAIIDQRFSGDINIIPGYGFSAIRPLAKTLSVDDTAASIKAGERATWMKVPMIDTTTSIGRTLDRILLEFEIEEAHWLSTAPQTDVALGDNATAAIERRRTSQGRKAAFLHDVNRKRVAK